MTLDDNNEDVKPGQLGAGSDNDGNSDDENIEDSCTTPMIFTTDLTTMTRHDDKTSQPARERPQAAPRKDVGLSASMAPQAASGGKEESRQGGSSNFPEKERPQTSRSRRDSTDSADSASRESAADDGESFFAKNKKLILGVIAAVVLVAAAAALFQTFGGRKLSRKEIFQKAIKSTVVLKTRYAIKGTTIGGGLGSGFFIAPHVICTNYHVAFYKIPLKELKVRIDVPYEACAVKLINKDGSFIARDLLGYDMDNDLALLYVPGLTAPPLVMRDQKDLSIGDDIHALGSPGGLEGVFNSGTISFEGLREGKYIEHNAAIGPGMSGGPLLDDQARVIGVNTLFIGGHGLEHASLNMSIPVRKVKELWESDKVQRKLKKAKEKTGDEDKGFE